MANAFSKEERVAFDDMMQGFEDALVLSRMVRKYSTDQQMMERARDTIWRPMPYIGRSFSGQDQSENFQQATQLSVPATIGFEKSSPWIMTATELRDAIQEKSLGRAATQKLASDINVAVMNVAASQGTCTIKVVGNATGFDDITLAEAVFNETGVMHFDRNIALSTRDYNRMAGNLAGRQNLVAAKTITAYEKAYVGLVASFDTWKLDYANRIAVAGGGGSLTVDVTAAGVNNYVPRATSVASTGEEANVDNRYQTMTFSSTTGVAAGDCFTIEGVNACHLITKQSTGQLKTFRVIAVLSATTALVSPPMITGAGGTDAELQYQNVSVDTSSATAAVVFLNTAAAALNPFWQADAIELLPSRYVVPENSGVAVMRATTEQGIEVTWTKWFDGDTFKYKFRADVRFGVVNKQPEMTGNIIFNQT